MEGIMYVLHGSKIQEKEQVFTDFINYLFQINPIKQQDIAFLEHHPNTIEKVGKNFIKQGVTHITVVPVLLFPAKHALYDIPEELSALKQFCPELEYTILDTFGHRKAVVQICSEHLHNEIEKKNKDEDFSVFLLYHGSKNFDQPLKRMTTLTKQFAQEETFAISCGSLMGDDFYQPLIQEQLEKDQTVYIFPYFLNEGRLVKRVQSEFQKEIQEGRIIFLETFAFDLRIAEDIVRQLSEMR